MNEPNKTNERPRKSILDFNSSWPLMIVYLGYFIGMYFAQQSTVSMLNLNNGARYGYYLIAIFAGLILTFVFYNVFKIIFAHIAGYKVRYMEFLGFCFDFSSGKCKFHYDISKILDVYLRFYPKDDDLKKNPKMIFLGGLVGELIYLAISLLLYFLFGFRKTSGTAVFGWGTLFAFIYGFVIVLYELIPLRQDVATDVFNLIKTSAPDDKEAFNLILVNKRRELQGEDFLIPSFGNYDSYYKAQTIYYLYLDNLHNGKLEAAAKNLKDMHYYQVDYPEYDRYLEPGENIYLHYLVEDEQGADKIYLALKNDDKNAIRKPTTLANYRSALFVAAYVQKSKEKVNEIVNQYQELLKTYPAESKRVAKEKELFLQVYKNIQKNLSNFELPDIQF